MRKTYSQTRKRVAKGFATAMITGIALAIICTNANAETFKFQNGTGYYIEDVSHLYPETGLVTEVETINEDKYLLTITVANGNMFQCETDVCDWFVNDLASMLMDNKGTENTVYDDEIILCYYSGVIEHFENHLVDED